MIIISSSAIQECDMGIKDLLFPTDPAWDKEHSNPTQELKYCRLEYFRIPCSTLQYNDQGRSQTDTSWVVLMRAIAKAKR